MAEPEWPYIFSPTCWNQSGAFCPSNSSRLPRMGSGAPRGPPPPLGPPPWEGADPEGGEARGGRGLGRVEPEPVRRLGPLPEDVHVRVPDGPREAAPRLTSGEALAELGDGQEV